MEEILASIRRIISEDDAPADGAPEAPAPVEAEAPAFEPEPEPVAQPQASAPPEPEPAAQPEAYPEPAPVEAAYDESPAADAGDEDDVLDLTERYEAPAADDSIGDLDLSSSEPSPEPAPPPQPQPQPAPAPAPVVAQPADPLVGAGAAGAAAAAFAGLTAATRTPADARSLEDIVRELLRPMLKDWLDANLPGIVEREVRAEVERISRQGGR